jgi:teichuronic acid biosynthesis glycosyltransferase TuaH
MPLVVFCAGTSWDGLAGSDRHLATALLAHTRLLWVDPPVSALNTARYHPGPGRQLGPRLSVVDGGMVRLTPAAPPGWTRPGMQHATWPLVRAQVRRVLRRIAVPSPHAVVACSLDDVLSGWPRQVRTVLYGTDDYVAGARLMRMDERYLLRSERHQVAAADLVVAVSPLLATRWGALGARQVAMLPNGCDAQVGEQVDAATVPAGLPLDRPVVGLIGQLSDRIDIELLSAVAALDCTLLLIGPHRAGWEPQRFTALVSRPNVVHVGAVPATALPPYLKAMDVGLTPYRDTPFNRASFPLKTLEYLAAGRAAVSTDLPATRWLDTELVAVASTPGEFAAAVRSALPSARDPRLVSRRRSFARQHSWPVRAAEFAGLIGLPTTSTEDAP